MSRFWTHAPKTVRPRSLARTSVLLCLLVFGLTATVVYRWGYEHWTPTNAKPVFTATAYVVERTHDASTSGIRLPIACADDDAQRAEETANALAERYVHDRRVEWQQRTETPCLKAREAAEQSRRALAKDEARLEAFQKQLATKSAKPQAAAPRNEKSTMVDNPAWIDLNAQLRDAERRHDQLLVDRTPLHPTVQEAQTRIEDIQRQMASVSRKIAGKAQSTAAAHDGEAESGTVAGVPSISKQDQEKLDDLTAAVERARQACDGAEGAEKQVLRLQQAGPQYEIENAQVVEIAATPDYGWRRLIWTTFLAGALMAFGVGSVSAGANLEPPVGSVAEVSKAANTAVVGTIPAHDPVPDTEKHSSRRWYARRTLIVLGLALIMACPAFAVWGVAGIY